MLVHVQQLNFNSYQIHMVSRILGFEKELQFTGTNPYILPEGPVSIFFNPQILQWFWQQII